MVQIDKSIKQSYMKKIVTKSIGVVLFCTGLIGACAEGGTIRAQILLFLVSVLLMLAGAGILNKYADEEV